jgi:toxin FitB
MMFLIDTNALSELRRGERADPGLAAWAAGADPADLFVSAITIFEIELGVAQVARRDAAQGAVLRRWIDTQVMPVFKDRILPVDAAVARRCAQLHVPDPRPQGDSLIAATALVHRLTVVTRNVRDFEPMGVPVLNPWGIPDR